MEYWEFLLQKEGDRSWLPLESPDVEILEGRYRVVARSSRINEHVDIRITQQLTEEGPPKRRTQKRSSRTNKDGLIVVIPFTRLQPGLWELRCSGDVMADMMGDSWQYTVKLQALSKDVETTSDWDSDWQAPSLTVVDTNRTESEPGASVPTVTSSVPTSSNEQLEASTQIAANSPLDQQNAENVEVSVSDENNQIAATSTEFTTQVEEVIVEVSEQPDVELGTEEELTQIEVPSGLLQLAEQMSQQIVESVFQAFDQEDDVDIITSSVVNSPGTSQPAQTEPLRPVKQPQLEQLEVREQRVHLTLDRETYVARRGQPLVLTGHVNHFGHQPEVDITLLARELQIDLVDPQSSQVLVDVRQPLPNQILPLTFACTIQLPENHNTRLILGRITVYGTSSTEMTLSALAVQPFTIAADLNELLEAIADNLSENEQLQPPLDFSLANAEDDSTEAYLNSSLLNLIETPKQPIQFQPSAGFILPPQIHQIDAEAAGAKAPQLPAISRTQPVPAKPQPKEEPAAIDPESRENTDAEKLDGSNQTEAEALGTKTTQVTSSLENEADLPFTIPGTKAFDKGIAGWGINTVDGSLEEELSPLDHAFRSLKLRDRFWSRLNALATDTELSAWLKEKGPVESILPTDDLEGATEAALQWQPTSRHPTLEDDLVAHEIVVDDEPIRESRRATNGHQAQTPSDSPASLALPEDEPVPIPDLQVTAGELTAGKPVVITVRLPDLVSRVYVKLWARDRQSRLLLDGPRWLVDFAPNGLGDLEASTQMTTPFGCLELQFEAIAVEMQTQRESNKVTVDRMVIPPDLPALSLDEFDT